MQKQARSPNAFRHFAPVLNAAGPAREIARRPFLLRVLAEGVTRGDAAAPRSELELIEVWWSRGGYDATRVDARRPQQVLKTAAEKGVLSFGRKVDVQGLDCTKRRWPRDFRNSPWTGYYVAAPAN
jgi:hypothetical protein